ncbi:MAG TPA: ParB/RepB/Spo0J family partition protein [Bellilinea sp.]|nr:ParB/RepB/Spo0J family partition protein [Bellilinea sp.]
MDFHEYASLFPMLDDIELGELTEDIRSNGLIEPIVLYEGKVLDGRNRYLACREANVEPRFVQYDGHDPLGFVVSKNLHRRHLTSSQLAVIALDVLPELEAKARERMTAGINQHSSPSQPIDRGSKGRATDEAATMLGTNRQHVSDAKKIAEEAPELIKEIRDGKLSISLRKMYGKLWVAVRFIQKDVECPECGHTFTPPIELVPSFEDQMRMLWAVGYCEDLKYPHGKGRHMITELVQRLMEYDPTPEPGAWDRVWLELCEEFGIPVRDERASRP